MENTCIKIGRQESINNCYDLQASTNGIELNRDNNEYINLGDWSSVLPCGVRPEECVSGFSMMMRLKLPIACDNKQNGFLSTMDNTGKDGWKISCAKYNGPMHDFA